MALDLCVQNAITK